MYTNSHIAKCTYTYMYVHMHRYKTSHPHTKKHAYVRTYVQSYLVHVVPEDSAKRAIGGGLPEPAHSRERKRCSNENDKRTATKVSSVFVVSVVSEVSQMLTSLM